MRAFVQNGYGDLNVLRLTEIEAATAGTGEVLVQVGAACINYGNVALVRGQPYLSRLWSGLRKPNFRVPGGDLSGLVARVGTGVTRFKAGDRVYGDLSSFGWGAYAEYASADEAALARMPSNLSYAEAAAVPQSALVALQALRKGGIRAGQQVMICGASGGNGTFAVQIAKALGAQVTAVCSARNVDMVRSLGAEHIIDYKKESLHSGQRRYDLILGMAGDRQLSEYRSVLKDDGTYISVGGEMRQVMQGLLVGPMLSLLSSQTLASFYQRPSQQDLEEMTDLIEAGKVKPVIDCVFPFEQTVQALEYYDTGRSQGKVVIQIGDLAKGKEA